MTTTSMPPLIFLVLGFALSVLGLLLLAIKLIRSGKRGRIVNDHPICRACGFDLYNLPSDRTKCPECGSDLTNPKAILPGYREPYLGRLWAGRALVAVVLIGVVVGGMNVIDRAEAQQLKPDWWLTLETRYASTPTQRLAWKHLTRRAKMGGLSDDRAASLTDFVLAWQGDLKQTWMSEAGDFVEAARSVNQVTDAQWKRYAMQAPQLSLIVRQQVRRGAPTLPAEIVIGKSRTGEQTNLMLRNTNGIARGDLIKLTPESHRGGGSHGQTLNSGGIGSTNVHVPLDQKAATDAALGKRTVFVDLDIAIREGWNDDSPEPASERRQFQATWELVEADSPLITLIPDDSAELRTRVEQAITIDAIQVKSHPQLHSLNIDFKLDKLPVALAHQVILREGDREWTPFKFKALASFGQGNHGYGASIRDFTADRVDVILEPSIDAALETIDMMQVWNGRIVIKDVKVTYETSTTQP